MGRVVNRRLGLWRIFKYFFNFKSSFDGNRIVLGPGNYEIDIDLDLTPKTLWLYITEEGDSIPVCQATANLLGGKIIKNGLNLSAKIVSNSALIEWFVEYS